MLIKIHPSDLKNHSVEEYFVEVAKSLSKANRCMIITGAGISCAAGIPDFRSKDGLYNLLKSKNPSSIVKGQDLFDANLFRSAEATDIFYRFMGEFKDMIGKCNYTRTHGFIKRLHDFDKLLRCYTQNIDDLELGLTLNTDIKTDPSLAKVVQMHGTMSRVKCTLVPTLHSFDFTKEYISEFKNGEPPNCPTCAEISKARLDSGKRNVPQGTLRPDIVLYNEHHPNGEVIGKLQEKDLRRRPDFLLVMGTSLKVPGCKRLVKEAAKIVHSYKNGKVIFVNLSDVGSVEWENVIDYHFKCSTDSWVNKIDPLFLNFCKSSPLHRSTSLNFINKPQLFNEINLSGSLTPLTDESLNTPPNSKATTIVSFTSPRVNLNRFSSALSRLPSHSKLNTKMIKNLNYESNYSESDSSDTELFTNNLIKAPTTSVSLPRTDSYRTNKLKSFTANNKEFGQLFDKTPTKLKNRLTSINSSIKQERSIKQQIKNNTIPSIKKQIINNHIEDSTPNQKVISKKGTKGLKRTLNIESNNQSQLTSTSDLLIKSQTKTIDNEIYLNLKPKTIDSRYSLRLRKKEPNLTESIPIQPKSIDQLLKKKSKPLSKTSSYSLRSHSKPESEDIIVD